MPALKHVLYVIFPATYFMTYHTILRTSDDFKEALKYSRDLSDKITRQINNWKEENETNDRTFQDQIKMGNISESVFPYR